MSTDESIHFALHHEPFTFALDELVRERALRAGGSGSAGI